MKQAIITSMVLAGLLATGAAQAADYQVQMLNKGARGAMVFEPDFIKAVPGDTVTFVATDKGHDAVSIDGMIPDGAQPFKGEMNKPVTVKIDKEGVYGVKCAPHYGMGMVALIVVGEPTNLEAAAAAKHPGKAKQVFADLVAKAT